MNTPKFKRGQQTRLKKCARCNLDFETFASVDKTYCSKNCFDAHRHEIWYERTKRPCFVCGALFVPKHNKAPGRTCSYACEGKRNRRDRITRMGYWAVMVPEHPNASAQGYVLEHRLIAERKIGRLLLPTEDVHHMNGEKKDNRPENLQVLDRNAHRSIHAKSMKRLAGSTRFTRSA